MEQTIIQRNNLEQMICGILKEAGSRRPMLVCGRSFMKRQVYKNLMEKEEFCISAFHDYEPNPKYESVVRGVEQFRRDGCDFLISAGGGSPMDVAKSIKAFVHMDDGKSYVEQEIRPNKIPHLAIPTTAGTGSESTHFAVIYYEGKKYSISDPGLLPEFVLLDAELLKGLPLYQRKATMMDALCHAVESFWSVSSSKESSRFSEKAIRGILKFYEGYLSDTEEGNLEMLKAANLAGQAINLTTTTAAHAMAYKLTSLYGISHGHAAVLCLPALWKFMLSHMDQVSDPRGREHVEKSFARLAAMFGCSTPEEAAAFIEEFVKKLGLAAPALRNEEELEMLVKSVNPQRLKNNPLTLKEEDLREIYRSFLK